MSKFEIRIVDFIKKNVYVMTLVAVSIFSALVRFSLKDYLSGDSMGYLLPWYDEFKSLGGLSAMEKQVGDYNILYQFFIALFTYIPVNPLYLYKLFSVIFDYTGAICIFYIIREIVGNNDENKWPSLIGYSAYLMNPTVFLNSACWAQCDAIYVSFCLATILFIMKEKYRAAFVMLGIALSFKLQAVLLLPFLCLYWFVSKRFSITKFFYAPAVFCLSGLPAILAGRSVIDVIRVYHEQSRRDIAFAINYPSFWYYFKVDYVNRTQEFYDTMKLPALILTFAVLLAWVIFFVVKEYRITKTNVISICFILVYTCVFFLPCMHERYGFLAEALAVVIAVTTPKLAPLMVGICSLSWFTYSQYLFDRTINIETLAIANGLFYIMVLTIAFVKCSKTKMENA